MKPNLKNMFIFSGIRDILLLIIENVSLYYLYKKIMVKFLKHYLKKLTK